MVNKICFIYFPLNQNHKNFRLALLIGASLFVALKRKTASYISNVSNEELNQRFPNKSPDISRHTPTYCGAVDSVQSDFFAKIFEEQSSTIRRIANVLFSSPGSRTCTTTRSATSWQPSADKYVRPIVT